MLSHVQLFGNPWLQPARLFYLWGFSRQEYKNGLPCSPPGDLPNSGIEPRSHVLQADSLSSEPPGKPKNIGMGSLSLLQGIFLSQKLNWGLLHCRRIICQLNYQGSQFLFYILKYFSNFSLYPYPDCTFFSWISAFHIWSLSLCFSLDPEPMTHCIHAWFSPVLLPLNLSLIPNISVQFDGKMILLKEKSCPTTIIKMKHLQRSGTISVFFILYIPSKYKEREKWRNL